MAEVQYLGKWFVFTDKLAILTTISLGTLFIHIVIVAKNT